MYSAFDGKIEKGITCGRNTAQSVCNVLLTALSLFYTICILSKLPAMYFNLQMLCVLLRNTIGVLLDICSNEPLPDTSITFSWTVPAPRLSYSVLVCQEDTLRCLPQVTCTDCSTYEATGLSPNTDYTVTVDSFSLVSNGECVSKGCTCNSATAQTGTYNIYATVVYIKFIGSENGADTCKGQTQPSSYKTIDISHHACCKISHPEVNREKHGWVVLKSPLL